MHPMLSDPTPDDARILVRIRLRESGHLINCVAFLRRALDSGLQEAYDLVRGKTLISLSVAEFGRLCAMAQTLTMNDLRIESASLHEKESLEPEAGHHFCFSDLLVIQVVATCSGAHWRMCPGDRHVFQAPRNSWLQ